MKTFVFVNKNNSDSLTTSAENFEKAKEHLNLTVCAPYQWRCENEEGEEE